MSVINDIKRMERDRVVTPPSWLLSNVHYLAIGGSESYGAATDLSDRDSQTYQSIRRGDWTLEHGKRWWESKERDLETLYANSKVLPRKPDEEAIKQLLLNCLETHFGSISTAVQRNPSLDNVLNDLHAVLNKYR